MTNMTCILQDTGYEVLPAYGGDDEDDDGVPNTPWPDPLPNTPWPGGDLPNTPWPDEPPDDDKS